MATPVVQYNRPLDPAVRNRRWLLIITIFAFVLLLAISVWSWWDNRYKKIELYATPGTEITFGTPNSKGDTFASTIAKTTGSTSVRVTAGSYLVRYAGNGFVTQTNKITVDRDLNLVTPPLELTPTERTEKLTEEKPAVRKAMDAEINLTGFSVSYETLYEDGDWYGAVYTPPTATDPIRVVMHKENGTWKLLFSGASIPEDDPQIPPAIVEDVNTH